MKANGTRLTNQPKDRRNRQAEMIKAALEIFAKKGYAAASVQDVADAVGVLKGSLYHYIDSKEDLLFQIFDNAHADAEELMAEVDAMEVDPVTRLSIYLQRSVQRTLENLQLQTLYFRDWRSLAGERLEKLAERRRQYDHYLRELIAEAYEAEGLVGSVNPRYVSSFVIGGTNWVADWYHDGGEDSAEEVARSYADLAMAAILGAATKAPAAERRISRARTASQTPSNTAS